MLFTDPFLLPKLQIEHVRKNMKRNVIIIGAVAVVAIVAIVVISMTNNEIRSTPPSNNSNATQSNTFTFELKLLNMSVLDFPHHELIGRLSANQSFRNHQPVFLQANFLNPNTNSHDYIVTSEIRGSADTSALSIVQGTVGGSGELSIDVYWKPEQMGDYDLILFAMPVEKLSMGPPMNPIAKVPLKVIE